MKTAIRLGLALLVILAIVVGYQWGAQRAGGPTSYAQDAANLAAAERAEEWWHVSLPIRVVFCTGLTGIGLAALAVVVRVAIRWLDRRGRTIYPDRNGVMPAVVLRPGETLADTGALAGPLVMGAAGPEYRLPSAAIPQLQAGATQGAAMTRTMRAWATHEAAHREAPPTLFPEPRPALPPVELLTGDEAHIHRLLEEGAE